MKKILTLLVLIVGFVAARAQDGDISGKVVDENHEGVPMANVVLVDEKGIFTGKGTSTDFDGNYSIKPLPPGKYNVQISYTGYATQILKGVVVNADKTTLLDINMKIAAKELTEAIVVEYKVPLIDATSTGRTNTVTADEIKMGVSKNITDIAASTGTVYQQDQGKGINIGGARDAGTQYYVDGVKVIGVPTVPASSIEQLQVLTSGIPAKYGDLTGGIINISTKGPTDEFHGGAEVQTTQGLDAYGYNLVNANLTGPIWKQKGTHKTIMSFFAAFEYLHQKDPNPSAVGVWQVRQNVLDSLREFPLVKKQTEEGFNLRSDNVTFADMFKQAVKPNTAETNFRGNGRIDIRPADNITLALGGSVSYRQYHDWVEQYTLFNSDNNPLNTEMEWRVFGRFTHAIQSKQSEEDEKAGKKKKSSVFQNAFYSIQVDYDKYVKKYEDDSHGFNPFAYGYIGKYQTKTAPVFQRDTFLTPDGKIIQGYKQVGTQDTAVAFTPGTLNPYGTRYTQEYYELLNAHVNPDGSYEVYGPDNTAFTSNINEIQANQALINGQRSNFVNNIWYNTGRQYDGFGYGDADVAKGGDGGNNDQYRVRLEGSFDLLKPGAPSRNKHSFEFGVEFEQRIQRSYSVSPLELWQVARQLVNTQLTTLDRSNPIYVINGRQYSYNDPNRPNFYTTDTILFNPLYNAAAQTYFDKQLRQSLGMPINGTNTINIDELNPSQLNLRMFSPSELLNGGSALVHYMGYDPYGNVLSSQPSFNDFFTKKDANGEYLRQIPAFRPIYTAAYLSDRFYFKDLTFNVGVRIDRYDANQEVLKDEYSLYPIKTVSEVTALPNGTTITHPSDIGGDYAVYVDNSKSPTAVTGYRSGNVWYDKYGNQLASAKSIALISNGGTINPYLENANENIKDSTFNPSGTFKNYKPRTIVMPRLQFSFNLTDRALFFAHYDILSQRPGYRSIMDPTDYLFFVENNGVALNNPNLQPSRVVDFELGFKQRVSNSAAFTVSAFYREFRDQVQITKIINAYPQDYITYDNVDFGTSKGFSLDFDMRRTKSNISLKANYTMQFAEGTGSTDQSQLNLINSTQPNFRTISPLNYDARHMINLNATYSFGSGRDYNGPVVKNSQILSESGITLQLTARSGTPYTAQSNTTPDGSLTSPVKPLTEGSINGSRLPWYFRVNMRVWKDFSFMVGKKKEKQDNKRELALEIYLQIQNLLNSKNVVQVYRYTGTANDNGYLNDPSNAAAIASYLNPQAFKDQYAAYINRPDDYSLPRRIYLGAVFSF